MPSRDDSGAVTMDPAADSDQPQFDGVMENLTLVLHGHAAFQYLHAGCAFEVFERLHRSSGIKTASLVESTGLSAHSARVLLFGLRCLKLIDERDGELRNGATIESLFERNEWDVFRATVFFHAEIVYPGEREFVKSLREGQNSGLSFLPGTANRLYERLASDSHLRKIFYEYMGAWTRHALKFLLQFVDFNAFTSILDVGGGDGTAAFAIAESFDQPAITVLELPEMESRIRANASLYQNGHRVKVISGDMFSSPWPANQDCVFFLHQLVIWNRMQNLTLLQRAHDSLLSGGTAFIVSSMANGDTSGPLMAAMDSAYFIAVAAGEGMIYPWTEYTSLLREAGFSEVTFQRFPTWTPHGMITARRVD